MTKQETITATHKGIASALTGAQLEMGKAIKSATNPHFRSKYADLGAVMDACLPALNKHGIAVIQPIGYTDGGMVVNTKFIHDSGEELECPVPLILGKNDMQGLGSAITYARRYGLMALAGIAPEDDDGNDATKNKRQTVSPDQYVKLRDKAEEAGVPEGKLCETYTAASLQQFPADAFDVAMKKLQLTIDRKAQEAETDGIPDSMTGENA